jgi:hypothetical protein
LKENRFSVSLGFMRTLTVTEAKPKLGHLVDLALQSKPVFIRRGQQVVQLVPAVLPDPIAVYPEGALTRPDHRIETLTQRFSEDEDQPLRR